LIVRPIVYGSLVRSSDRSIVRPFVRPNNLFPAVMLPKFRSSVRPIVHGSFVRLSVRSIVRPFVRSFDRSSVRSSKKSFSCRYAAKIPIVRSFDH
jgi:hypothetical protein